VLRDGYHSEQTVPTFGEQLVAMEAEAKTHRGAHAVKLRPRTHAMAEHK
jgi:hypothetical protein